MWEEAKGEGRAGRFGFMTESNERMRDTVSDKGETALVGPPLDLPWLRFGHEPKPTRAPLALGLFPHQSFALGTSRSVAITATGPAMATHCDVGRDSE
jgi:hypothetical protein